MTGTGRISRRNALLDSAMAIMGVLEKVCRHLVTLPASDAHPGVTFAIVRAVEPLCEIPDEWRVAAERMDELARGTPVVHGRDECFESVAAKLTELARTLSSMRFPSG